jgi:preprotein translocase subunit SecG
MTILINIFLVLEVFVALLMMLVILMQRPKSEGLGAAFGGGVTENIFGAQTTNVLTTATTWLASIFFAIALALSILYAHRTTSGSAVRRELEKSAAASKTAPLPPKEAAKQAAADAKAEVKAQTVPTKPAGTAKPADLAVGAAPVEASVTPAPSPQPTP